VNGPGRGKSLITRFFSVRRVAGPANWPIYFFAWMIGPGREKRLITRFFGSPCQRCDKLADLFSGLGERSGSRKAPHNSIFSVRRVAGPTNWPIYFFAWMIGPGRGKRLVTRFFGSPCPGFDRLADLFFHLFHLDGWSESRKVPNNSIFSVTLSWVRQIGRFIFFIFHLDCWLESRKSA